MEARSLLSEFCSNSTNLILQKTRKLSTARIVSSSSSFIQSHNRVSFKTHYHTKLVSQRVEIKRRLQCTNSVEKAEDLNAVVKDSGNGVRHKKLAVFVSGGGSNFRSIHEATVEGRVKGDIVVLVTNKSGCGGAEYARASGIPVILFPKTKETEGLSPTDLVSALRKNWYLRVSIEGTNAFYTVREYTEENMISNKMGDFKIKLATHWGA